MRILEFPKYGLQHLVQHYIGANLDKDYQRADWRIRCVSMRCLNE